MDKRAELHKNVKSTPLQDSLSCTDACLKAVADNMVVIKRNPNGEMLEKPERNKEKPVRNKEKTEEDTFTFYWYHPNPAKNGFKNRDNDCYLARE